MPLQSITIDQFEKETNQPGVTVLYVYKTGCPWCAAFEPTYQRMVDEMPSVRFLKMEGASQKSFVLGKGVRSFPALMIFKDGKMEQIIQGSEEERAFDKLKGTIESFM